MALPGESQKSLSWSKGRGRCPETIQRKRASQVQGPPKGPVAARSPREPAGQGAGMQKIGGMQKTGGMQKMGGMGGAGCGETPQDHVDPSKSSHLYLEKHEALEAL